MNLKKCCNCKNTKEITEYYNDKYKNDGKTSRCKKCCRLYINNDNRKIYEKKYREEHKEYRKEIVKKSMNKNKEHHKNKRKEYLKTEKGRISYKRYTQKRYALKKTIVTTKIDYVRIYKRDNKKCKYCGKILKFKEIHIDHYIPLSKGGKHIESNLNTSCAFCNLSKGNKMPKEWRVDL